MQLKTILNRIAHCKSFVLLTFDFFVCREDFTRRVVQVLGW
jgi:hypothetical protein